MQHSLTLKGAAHIRTKAKLVPNQEQKSLRRAITEVTNLVSTSHETPTVRKLWLHSETLKNQKVQKWRWPEQSSPCPLYTYIRTVAVNTRLHKYDVSLLDSLRHKHSIFAHYFCHSHILTLLSLSTWSSIIFSITKPIISKTVRMVIILSAPVYYV